jgi:AraC-like DNA-binding protein
VDHVTSAVAAYVARLYPAHPADKERKLAAWQQDRAREMLVSKPVADLSIAQVARECGMPLQQFVAAFKRSTGELPHEWLMKERARRNPRTD